MFGFKKQPKNTVEASGLTGLEQQLSAIKQAEMEIRIHGLEVAIIELCKGLKYHLDRIDANTQHLDKNMHSIAALTIRLPKDLLNGGSEPN